MRHHHGGDETAANFGVTQTRFGHGQGQIAHRDQSRAAGNGRPVHRRNRWLRQRVNEIEESCQAERILPHRVFRDWRCRYVERLCQFGQIHAGTENGAGPGQDYAARSLVIAHPLERLRKSRNEFAAESITPFRTIQGKDRCRRLNAVEDQRIAHGSSSAGRSMAVYFSGGVIGICSNARASVFPCVSTRSDWLAPPAKTSYRTKFSARRLAAS